MIFILIKKYLTKRLIKKFLFYFILFLISGESTAQQAYETEHYLEGVQVYQITGFENEIWAATYGSGVAQFVPRNNRWAIYSTKNKNVSEDFFYSIAVGKRYVWAGSADGLYIMEKRRKRWSKRKFALGGEMGNWIRSLCYDKSKNVLWIGRFKNVTKLDVGKKKLQDYDLTIGDDFKTNTIKVIKLDEIKKRVWFGTEAGIHIYDQKKELSNPISRVFLTNKEGNFNEDGEAVSISDIVFETNKVWIGNDEFITPKRPRFQVGGIYKYNYRATWERLGSENGLPANGVYCMLRTGNIIWVSLYKFDPQRKEQYGRGVALINRTTDEIKIIEKHEFNVKFDKIYSMYFDGSNIWFGTDNGIIRLRISNEMARWK